MRKFYHDLLKDVLADVVNRFQANYRNSSLPRNRLEERGISTEVSESFGVGFATEEWNSLAQWLADRESYYRDCARTLGLVKKGQRGFFDQFRDRLVLPVRDQAGDPVGLTSRSLASLRESYRPKKFDETLLNSSHSPIFDKWNYLLGFREASESLCDTGRLIVTQDPIDLLELRSRGHTSSVMELIPGSFDRADEGSQHRKLLDKSTTLDVLARGEEPANNPDR